MADKLATVELSSAQIGQLALVVGDWIGNQNKVFYEGYFEIEELGRLLDKAQSVTVTAKPDWNVQMCIGCSAPSL